MKINLFKYLLIVLLTASFVSCQEENFIEADNELNTLDEKNTSQLETKYRLLDITPNAYHKYFKQTDNTIGFNSLKKNAHSDYSLVERLNFPSDSEKSVRINGKAFISQKSKSSNLDSEDIYGKTLSIQLGDKSGKTTSGEIKMYVPKKLNISKPIPISEKNVTILAHHKNFLLEWNADPKNEEGLMLAIEYLGENVDARKNTDIHIQNVDHIEYDNGKYILKQAMFDDIPNLAYVNLILLRGNVEISEFNNETLKLYAESHQRVPLIIVKDLNSVRTLD